MLLSAELIDYNGQEALLSMFVDVTDRKRIEAELHGLNEALEQRVAERTAELAASNQELSSAMATLTRTQDELVHSEKLASLGKLVAGVAHELNTPIGNALTASSTVTGVARQFVKTMESGTVRRSALTSFVSQMHDGANLIERSLYRAADLLASFKQVAIDQASERRRPFDLAHVVRDVVDTLRPTLKAQPWVIEVTIPDGIAMESFPGPIDQIVINLVMNATIHAFAGRDHGRVCLAVENLAADTLDLVCSDDGVGIPSEHLGRVFDPFFTSRLGHGGSGLGLSITHRLTTQVLGGQISLSSVVGEGTRFVLHLPRQAPEVVS